MKTPFRILAISVLFLVALVDATAAEPKPAKPPMNGHWKWTFAMPNGTTIEPKLKLKQDGEALSGTTTFRPGYETAIQQGTFKDNQVSFVVVRERDGQKVTTRYHGQLSGDVIKGTVESDWTGESRRYDWLAQRVPETATGTWQWSVKFGEIAFETKLKLKQDREKLTGKIAPRGRSESDITEGKIKDGELSFEANRERDGVTYYSKYTGKLDGDTITGQVEFDFGGAPTTRPWEAKRVEDPAK